MIFNNSGHEVPTHEHGEGGHRPNHPSKPQPPVVPEKPVRPTENLVIIVNGMDKILPIGTKKLSYEEVVKLAYGNYVNSDTVIYTVVYSNGPIENKKGTMVKGSIVAVRKGMIFNVGRSDKS